MGPTISACKENMQTIIKQMYTNVLNEYCQIRVQLLMLCYQKEFSKIQNWRNWYLMTKFNKLMYGVQVTHEIRIL